MLYDEIVRREPVEKGWSADKKYKATLLDGTVLLLRISPENRREAVASCFRRMQEAQALGIGMCTALEWGGSPEGVWSLQSWIEGDDAEVLIPGLSPARQYRYGLEAGRDLRKLHTMAAPGDIPAWEVRYGAKIDRKLRMYQQSPLKYEDDGCILRYIRENRHLIVGRPQTYQHGDHHIGNMMIDNAGTLVLIDFEKQDVGDPWEEFNRIVWSAQAAPAFASGTVDGYFDGQVPELFWRLLALYICTNTLGSLPWAIPFGQGEIGVMLEQERQVLRWYDGMDRIVPSWYAPPVTLSPVTEKDRDMLAGLLTDETVGRTYMVPDELDRAMAERIACRYMELSATPDRFVRIIRAGDAPVGVIHDVGIRDGCAELGWALLPAYWGKGLCTEAVRLAVEALRALGLRRVTAGAFADNTASLRVMEKNGMVRTGREETVSYRGERRRCIYHSLDLEGSDRG